MTFTLLIKTDDEMHQPGDLVYAKRQLMRVEHVSKPRGPRQKITVRFRVIGKINLDACVRVDRAVPKHVAEWLRS